LKQDWVDVNTSKAAPEAVSMIYYFSALTDGGVYYVSDSPKMILDLMIL
jgi:hypothetical protein